MSEAQKVIEPTKRPTTSIALGAGVARSRHGRRFRRGLTLIELLVVITILGLIAGIVGVNVIGAFGDAQVDSAKIQIGELGKSLDAYKLRNHRYPTTQEGLAALSTSQGGGKPIMEKIPKDPWGNDYIYVCPGQHNPSKFDLQSKGDDATPDTEDDITNWK